MAFVLQLFPSRRLFDPNSPNPSKASGVAVDDGRGHKGVFFEVTWHSSNALSGPAGYVDVSYDATYRVIWRRVRHGGGAVKLQFEWVAGSKPARWARSVNGDGTDLWDWQYDALFGLYNDLKSKWPTNVTALLGEPSKTVLREAAAKAKREPAGPVPTRLDAIWLTFFVLRLQEASGLDWQSATDSPEEHKAEANLACHELALIARDHYTPTLRAFVKAVWPELHPVFEHAAEAARWLDLTWTLNTALLKRPGLLYSLYQDAPLGEDSTRDKLTRCIDAIPLGSDLSRFMDQAHAATLAYWRGQQTGIQLPLRGAGSSLALDTEARRRAWAKVNPKEWGWIRYFVSWMLGCLHDPDFEATAGPSNYSDLIDRVMHSMVWWTYLYDLLVKGKKAWVSSGMYPGTYADAVKPFLNDAVVEGLEEAATWADVVGVIDSVYGAGTVDDPRPWSNAARFALVWGTVALRRET